MFSESFLTELADRNDIVDVVSEYVSLGKRSGANYFGLCPFHNEKTPSFSVSPEKQIYYCFGCGKGGGVINFMMEIEQLSYPEAIERLAKRAGIPVPEQENDAQSRRRARLYEVNKAAALYFHEQLNTPGGAGAREYINKRQISRKMATSFGLGYAPDSYSAFEQAMLAQGYTSSELASADLIRPGSKGGTYATFRNRLMFPVIDVRGNVTGFSGRIIGDGEPKYLNTKDTPVFSKGRLLFGLNLARKSKRDYIILVEGNVDVVSLHQAGFDSAVASLGTSLTKEQAQLISRYKKEVVLAYDNDGAGLKASQRAIDILEKLDVKVKVLRWEGAKDPDEYIKTRGGDAFQNLIDRSESQIDYRLMNIKKKYDLTVPEQKVDFLHEATKLIATFPGSVERQVYAVRVAEQAGIMADAVSKEVEQQRKRLLSGARREAERNSRPVNTAQPQERSLRYENLPSATAEEGVIRLLYLEPSLYQEAEASLTRDDFTSETLGHIYSILLERIRANRPVNTTVLSEALTGPEMNLLVSILNKPENLSNAKNTLKDYIKTMKDQQELSQITPDLRSLADQLKNSGKGYRS
ncbi:MAG: DNA primase [Oscillospiraceae bacterium]|nr:DNA primase [Oscillospiraceae bacterium]